jgi:glycine cleavage system aminomethyltransferase T
MAELTACHARAGLADLGVRPKVAVRCAEAARALSLLTGRALEPGDAVRRAGTLWCVLDRRRLLVAGPGARPSAVRAILAETTLAPACCTDVTDDQPLLAIVGPRAGAVVDALSPALRTRACRDGDRWLLAPGAADRAAAWTTVREAGRPFGLVCVSDRALACLDAARAR